MYHLEVSRLGRLQNFNRAETYGTKFDRRVVFTAGGQLNLDQTSEMESSSKE